LSIRLGQAQIALIGAATVAVDVAAATFVVHVGAAEEIQPINRLAITITYKALMAILLFWLTLCVSGRWVGMDSA
jgi:hypothetical protein